jgi:hypothetical protein
MNPKSKDSVQVQDLPDGSALLYDTEKAIAYPVTETAALVWRACDGTHSLEQIVDKLHAEFDAARETIVDDVTKLIDDLASKGLIDASSVG